MMFRFLRALLCTLTMLLSFPATADSAKYKQVHEVSNICMNIQRLLKDYALIGMLINYHDPVKDREEILERINASFEYLTTTLSPGEARDKTFQLNSKWQTLREKLIETPDKDKAHDLRLEVESFVNNCVILADDLALETGNEAEHDVVLIANLGMENQRLAALYMIKVWDEAGEDYFEEVAKILEETERVELELLNANEALVPPEVKAKLQALKDHFRLIGIMASTKSGRFVPTAMERSVSQIYNEVMEILELEQEIVE